MPAEDAPVSDLPDVIRACLENDAAALAVDRSGRICSSNPALGELLGYGREELDGLPLEQLLPERLRAAHRGHLARFFAGPRPRHLPFGARLVARHRDGRELNVDISLMPVEHAGETWGVAVLRPHSVEAVERALRERLDFEALIADITALVVAALPDEIDAALLQALDRLREAFGADRAVLLEYSDDWSAALLTHVAYRPGVSPIPERVDVRNLFPWIDRRLSAGETIVVPDTRAMPPEAAVDSASFQQLDTLAVLIVAIRPAPRFRHAIVVDSSRQPRTWPAGLAPRMRLLGEILVDAQARGRHAQELARANEELTALKARLEAENVYLREEVKASHGFDNVVGRSPALARTLALVERVAPADSTVLITGETGAGKEVIAQAIHDRSPRRDGAFVRVNCAALPPTLIEAELFGQERGAFTGAIASRAGRFEVADGGTLLLDEVGELGLDVQPKLLRLLQTGEFERIGSARTRRGNVRIIAATNRDLGKAVREGTFRADLFYRLNVFPIEVPPLRERREDIPLLVWWHVQSRQRSLGRHIERIPARVMDELCAYPWPGNVRELQNVVERALILSTGDTLQLEDGLLRDRLGVGAPHGDRLEDVERAHFRRVLDECGGRINGDGNAAERLGLAPSTVRFRMRKLGLELPSARPGPGRR